MQEYFVRTKDGDYAEIITAENGHKAVEIFKKNYDIDDEEIFYCLSTLLFG